MHVVGPPVITALLYGASGAMKVFMFEKVSGQVPSFEVHRVGVKLY